MKKIKLNSIVKQSLLVSATALLGILPAGQIMAQQVGAQVPWTTYEAEAAITNGVIHSGSDDRGKISYEASGRSAVELNKDGGYVTFKSTVKANRVTIRYSIAKGESGNLALYINNVRKREVGLTSFRLWNDKPALPNKFCRFFDEVIIEENIKRGDEIKLMRETTAGVASCTIDFIDLEDVSGPLKKSGRKWLDVKDFGAKPNDEIDDTKAITDCINAAAAGSKKVWIPAGYYYINDQVNIPAGVQVEGAGMWHTVIRRNIPAASIKRSFQMADSTIIKNLKIDDVLGNIRINNHEGIRFSSSKDVLIDGIWIANTFGAGILGANASNVVIRNCRVFGSFADAIHISRKSVNCLAENNLVRNSGDDGLAIVTYNSAGCHDITYRNNTVWLNYWGRGITMIGGDNNKLEYNLVVDGSKAGLLVAVEEYNKQITPYVTNFSIQYNKVIRCGDVTNQNLGGIWLWGNVETSPMSGIVSHNEIIDPVRHGISVTNWVPKEVVIEKNTIGQPGINGQSIYIATVKAGFGPVIRENAEYTSLKK